MDLYPYQHEGADFLLRGRAYLADEMGLGKTVQAAAAAEAAGVEDALVVAPASALENWKREWEVWGPERGTLEVISYSALIRNPLPDRTWDAVILDEAHYCKNPRAKRTLAALNAARRGHYAWLLSGTPMPNHPGELWAPIRALWPEIPAEMRIDSYQRWFNHFCRWSSTRFGPYVYGTQNQGELRHILRRIMLRRKLDEIAVQLPPLRVTLSLLPRDDAFAEALEGLGVDPDRLEARMEREEDDEEAGPSRLRRLLGEYKAPRIGKILAQELEGGEYEKIVVLAYHRSVIYGLRKAFDPFGVVGFIGDTPRTKRQEAIDSFNEGDARVFLAQQTAAGQSINLQAASEIVLVEPDWSPDANRQAIKRVHRIGQDRPCRARIFAVADSLDQAVMGRVATKSRIQKQLGL